MLSMKIAPFLMPEKAPSLPMVTARKSLSLPTQQNTKSAFLAAVAGVGAVRPEPYSLTQASALAALRL